jgi:hypothetical protein
MTLPSLVKCLSHINNLHRLALKIKGSVTIFDEIRAQNRSDPQLRYVSSYLILNIPNPKMVYSIVYQKICIVVEDFGQCLPSS